MEKQTPLECVCVYTAHQQYGTVCALQTYLLPLVHVEDVLVLVRNPGNASSFRHQLKHTVVKSLIPDTPKMFTHAHTHNIPIIKMSLAFTLSAGSGGCLGRAVWGNRSFLLSPSRHDCGCSGTCSLLWLTMRAHKCLTLCLSHELMFLFHIYHDLVLFPTVYYLWVKLTWPYKRCQCVGGWGVFSKKCLLHMFLTENNPRPPRFRWKMICSIYFFPFNKNNKGLNLTWWAAWGLMQVRVLNLASHW